MFQHIGCLYKSFDVQSGGSLVCSQYSDGKFRTYIFNNKGCEIEYPKTILQRRGFVSYQGICSKMIILFLRI